MNTYYDNVLGLLTKNLVQAAYGKINKKQVYNYEEIYEILRTKMGASKSLGELFYYYSLLFTEFPVLQLKSSLFEHKTFKKFFVREDELFRTPLNKKIEDIASRVENQKDFFEISDFDYHSDIKTPLDVYKFGGVFNLNNAIIINELGTLFSYKFKNVNDYTSEYVLYSDYSEKKVEKARIVITRTDEYPYLTYTITSNESDSKFSFSQGFLLNGYSTVMYTVKKYQVGPNPNFALIDNYSGKELFRFSYSSTTNSYLSFLDSNNRKSLNRSFVYCGMVGITHEETDISFAMSVAIAAALSYMESIYEKWARVQYNRALFKNEFISDQYLQNTYDLWLYYLMNEYRDDLFDGDLSIGMLGQDLAHRLKIEDQLKDLTEAKVFDYFENNYGIPKKELKELIKEHLSKKNNG